VTYDAVIDVQNPQLKLRPGMTANVTFVYADRPDALRTANAALRFKPTPELLGKGADNKSRERDRSATSLTSTQPRGKRDDTNTRRTLWVLRNKRPVAVPVKTGITDGTHTELLEGDLHEGDAVITDISGSPTNSGSPNGRSSGAPGGPGAPGGFRRIL
jgi:HlyD family secretion protein